MVVIRHIHRGASFEATCRLLRCPGNSDRLSATGSGDRRVLILALLEGSLILDPPVTIPAQQRFDAGSQFHVVDVLRFRCGQQHDRLVAVEQPWPFAQPLDDTEARLMRLPPLVVRRCSTSLAWTASHVDIAELHGSEAADAKPNRSDT